jgi:hypothetical protein
MSDGGRGEIRTHGTLAGTPHFECGAFNHSTTRPTQQLHPPSGGEVAGNYFMKMTRARAECGFVLRIV